MNVAIRTLARSTRGPEGAGRPLTASDTTSESSRLSSRPINRKEPYKRINQNGWAPVACQIRCLHTSKPVNRVCGRCVGTPAPGRLHLKTGCAERTAHAVAGHLLGRSAYSPRWLGDLQFRVVWSLGDQITVGRTQVLRQGRRSPAAHPVTSEIDQLNTLNFLKTKV